MHTSAHFDESEPISEASVLASRRKVSVDVRWVIAVGLVFIILLYFKPRVATWITGTGQVVSVDVIQQHGMMLVIGTNVAQIVTALLLLPLLVAQDSRPLRDALTVPAGRRIAIASIFGLLVLLSTAGDTFRLWPFSWRSNPSAIEFAQALAAGPQIGALVLWSTIHGLLTPLIEEVVFRFGLLRLVLAKSNSRILAVAASAVVFGAAHLGYPWWQPDSVAQVRAASALLVGLGLGVVTLASRGRLWPAIVIHAARNLSEVGWLLMSL